MGDDCVDKVPSVGAMVATPCPSAFWVDGGTRRLGIAAQPLMPISDRSLRRSFSTKFNQVPP